MTMPPGELPAYLESVLIPRILEAPPEVSYAMAQAFEARVRRKLLHYAHAPFTRTPSPRDVGTPGFIFGELQQSIHSVRGIRTAFSAQASTGPYVVYGRIQELGGDIYPKRAKWLHWRNLHDGRMTDWYSKHVELPKRPYLAPTAAEVVSDGTLTNVAFVNFILSVWGMP